MLCGVSVPLRTLFRVPHFLAFPGTLVAVRFLAVCPGTNPRTGSFLVEGASWNTEGANVSSRDLTIIGRGWLGRSSLCARRQGHHVGKRVATASEHASFFFKKRKRMNTLGGSLLRLSGARGRPAGLVVSAGGCRSRVRPVALGTGGSWVLVGPFRCLPCFVV